ncbi:choice-of-anchor A family protein [Pseudoduganella umbonata]|uniref:Choice-of-anchor A domain-containing protein n=1 Tax=Pseudoduganella umbonata TaxID=864828 RepID=A0A4P8HU61_9BURK|nr:choice-of-anchor A family protein [Pseudoduganella umbonata]MBB3223639.1 choice-of-anchor A domain-containing protein [Pseudoduganella umbonata]QCP13499.1 choice-of-anchor A family protein [Pseudoduganella umbonata]
MLRLTIAAILSAAFAIAHAAPAPLTATQVLNQMNAVSLTDITARPGGHVHGRTWAAGTVTDGQYGNQLGAAPKSDYAGLTAGSVVGSKNQWGQGNLMVNQGGAVINGSASNLLVNDGSSVINGNVSGTTFNGAAYVAGNVVDSRLDRGGLVTGTVTNSPINGGTLAGMTAGMATANAAATSTNFGGVLNNLSNSLSRLDSTGSTVKFDGSKATFSAVADATGVAVFDLTGIDDTLFAANEFDFKLNGATTVIMNTDIKSASIHANFLGGSARNVGSQVIWNFYDATSLTISSQFGGTVLATDALVTNTADIEGGLFANALDLRAQVHVQPFTGNVDSLSPVPEPTMVAMIMAGLAVFGVGRARRRECFTR